MERDLSRKDLALLRSKHLITENEVAFWVGDRLIAENVMTKIRRVIEMPSHLMFESKKRLIKG